MGRFHERFSVDYATAGPNMYGLMGGQTNAIPTMQADLTKDVYPTYGWANVMRVPYVDMQSSSRSAGVWTICSTRGSD